MKKSTKIISTAIALVLVMGFMVVGILAATTASATIGATVSWSATAGLEFTFKASTYGTQADYQGWLRKGNTGDYWSSDNASSSNSIASIVVDTTTSNNAASGMTRTLNGSFVDPTDDGVNNPKQIAYVFEISNDIEYDAVENDDWTWTLGTVRHGMEVSITDYPVSTNEVKVEWMFLRTWSVYQGFDINEWYEMGKDYDMLKEDVSDLDMITFRPGSMYYGLEHGIIMFLTLKNPDVSLESFDASVSFEFTRVELQDE